MNFIKISNIIKRINSTPFSWLTLQEIFTFIVNYGLVVILAKLLTPESFGIVTLLNIYTGFFGVISGLGIGKLIVKEQIRNQVKLNALFVGNVIVSFVIFVIALLFLSLYLKFYFDNETSYFYYGVLSLLSIFTGSLYTFTTALYIRDKAFIKMAKLTIFAYAISFSVVIVITYFFRTTLSLLLKQLIVALSPIIILLSASNFKLKPVYSKTVLKYFFSFSKFITLDNLFNYFVRNIDYLILGKFFDKSIVGQYSIAYKILITPVKLIVKQIDKISFPSLAQMTYDLAVFKKYYLSNIRLISQTLFPVVIAIILFSDVIVSLFFDDRYDKLALIVSVLSISALFQSVTALVGNMFIIGNQTKIMFQLTFVKSIMLTIILIFAATYHNILIFTFAYVLAYIVTNFPVTNYYALKPFNISVLEIIKTMLKPIVISIIFLSGIKYFDYLYELNMFVIIMLIILCIITIYLLINEKIRKLLGI